MNTDICSFFLYIPSVLWYCWWATEGHPACKTGCWFVSGDILTGV